MDGAIFFSLSPCPSGFVSPAWLGFPYLGGALLCSFVPCYSLVLGSGSIPLTALAVSSFRSGGSDNFFSRPSPSPRLSSVCLLELFPRPRAWDVRASCLFAVCGRSVRFACVACVPCRSLTAFVRSCLVIALAVVVLPVGLPIACLAVAMLSRRASSPLIGFRACPSSVIRLMWLSVPSCGFACCPCPLLACRCHPLGGGYNPDTPFAPSGRVVRRGGL